MGNDSGWAPCICRLPRPVEMHCTIFWSDDELELIRQSSVYQETINQRSQIEKEFLAIRTALKNFPEMSKSITYKNFTHAYALAVASLKDPHNIFSLVHGGICGYFSSMGKQEGLFPGNTFTKIPLFHFAEFFNHDETSESIVLSDDDKHFSEVIADRDYAPGEQVLIRYGEFSNAALLLDFGFTPTTFMIHDQVEVQVNIPHHDVLHGTRKFSCYMQKTLHPEANGSDLLNGELCIFKSASAWLRNYCKTDYSRLP